MLSDDSVYNIVIFFDVFHFLGSDCSPGVEAIQDKSFLYSSIVKSIDLSCPTGLERGV